MTTDKESALHDFLKDAIQEIGDQLSAKRPLDFLEAIEEQENKRANFISSYRRIPIGIDPFLVILRRWNSYTPSLPSTFDEKSRVGQYSIGGGYFLFVPCVRWEITKGYGLVIDPGYNFIHNFGLAGFCLDDIDGILITHAHNDHTNDFESLLALLHERNVKYRGDRLRKTVDLFLNVGSFKKFSNYLDLSKKSADADNCIGNLVVMSPGQSYYVPGRENDLELEIIALFANHHEIVTASYAVGVCLKAAGRNIYITGDTGWSFETAEKNIRLLQKHDIDISSEEGSQRIHIMVSHLGSMKRQEFELIATLDWKNAFYENHLGVLGTLSMIQMFEPELCIISEFGEELSQLRIQMAEALEEQAKRRLNLNIRCLAGDVGLWAFPHSQKSLCYLTGNKTRWEDISCELNPAEISILYVDEDYFGNLSTEAQKKSRLLNSEKGLEIVRNLRRKEVIEEYNLDLDPNLVTKAQIISRLASIDNIKLHIDDFNSEQIAGILLLSTFDITCADLLDSVANDFPDASIIQALEWLGYDYTTILSKYFISCGTEIAAGDAEWERPIYAKPLHRHLAPKMHEFMDCVKKRKIDEAERVLEEFSSVTIQSIFETLTEDEKVVVLSENPDNIIDDIETTGKYPELCRVARKAWGMAKERLDIENTAFAIVKPEIGCPSGYPVVNEITLRGVLEQEEDEDRRNQLSEVLTELQNFETRQSNNMRLTKKAIELLTTVNDVVDYLTSMLADEHYADQTDKVQNAIHELQTWSERDAESERCDSLDQNYKDIRRICAADRSQFLRSIDPSYFVPKLRELLAEDISSERREEVESLIKEIEERAD